MSPLSSNCSPRKPKPRRINAIAMDQEGAYARLLLKAGAKNANVEHFERALTNASRLLRMRIHRKDVAALTGLSSTHLGALAKSTGATNTTGAKKKRVGTIVMEALAHCKASSFLCALESVLLLEQDIVLTGDVFLDAIDSYSVHWHHDLVPVPYTLYFRMAQLYVEKKIYLTDCPTCKMRYLQLHFDQRDPSNPLEGECPQCRLLTSMASVRPKVVNGVPLMKPVSRIRRTIGDHQATGKAHRLVMIGNDHGRSHGSLARGQDSKAASWWPDEEG